MNKFERYKPHFLGFNFGIYKKNKIPPNGLFSDPAHFFSQVLRFSRLFKPTYTPNIWRKKKKKKPTDSPEKSKVKIEITPDPKDEAKEGIKEEKNEENQDKALEGEGIVKMEVEAGESDVIQVKDEPLSDEEEYTIELKFGKMPEPDELGIDQTVRKKNIY